MGFYEYKPRKGIPAFRKQGKALIKAISAIEEFRGGKLPEGALPSKFYPRELE